MRVRASLFTKILLWFFANLFALAVVLFALFNLQFRFAPDSPLFAAFGNRLDFVAGLVADEFRSASPEERSAVLQRYAASYRVEFLLYTDQGERLAGPGLALPADVLRRLTEMPPPPPRRPPPRLDGPRPSPPFAQPMFRLRTSNPTRYWAGVRLPVGGPGQPRPVNGVLVASSDSISGHGLFFDVRPWLFLVAVVLALSSLLWLPFVRGLTVSIKQMTAATEQIADERFETRVNVSRSDELGRLGHAINQMAARLESFVNGQRRFLGGISHELNSPLARLQFALGILEERVEAGASSYVTDAQDDVRLMSEMVNELLTYAKAGLKTMKIELVRVPLLPLVQAISAREAPGREIVIDVADSAAVLAHPELLSRAIGNLLRNAARYAAGTGPITIAARSDGDQVTLNVADRGPGVPPESIDGLFEPFFRVEPDRARATGGTGLGLAIVKTCVEACQGTVAARNLSPTGLQIAITLRAA